LNDLHRTVDVTKAIASLGQVALCLNGLRHELAADQADDGKYQKCYQHLDQGKAALASRSHWQVH